jgi:hypothetical protein
MPRVMRLFCVALLTIAGLAGASLTARADDDRCERKIHQAEAKLHEAVERYGENSRKAHKRREQLEEVKRRCGDRHDDHHDHDMDHDHH